MSKEIKGLNTNRVNTNQGFPTVGNELGTTGQNPQNLVTRREFLELAFLFGLGTVLAACNVGGGKDNLEQKIKEALRGLCEGIGSSSNPFCSRQGFNPLNPPPPDEAIRNMGKEYVLFINPESIEGAVRTAEWWGKYGSSAVKIVQIFGGEAENTPYYDMTAHLSSDPNRYREQALESLYGLVEATSDDGRELVLNVGPSSTLSPLQQSQLREGRTVIAVDLDYVPFKEYPDSLPNLQGRVEPSIRETSFAAFYKLDLFEIKPSKLKKPFDEAVLIAPNILDIRYLIEHTCDISKRVVVIPEQSVLDEEEYTFDLYARKLALINCLGKKIKIIHMTLDQIKNTFGSYDSYYIDPKTVGDRTLPVIIIE